MSDQEVFLDKRGTPPDGPQVSTPSWRGAAGHNLLAGLTLAAITIPEQMATAKLGGFEPQLGLWAFVAATLGFVIFGASRTLTAGADSTITPIFSSTLAALAVAGTASLGSAAVTLAFLVGVLLALGGLFKLGWIANLLSQPVITGFLAGIAVHILASQLPNLFGITVVPTDTPSRLVAIVEKLGSINPFSTGIGLFVFVLMVAGERISDRLPAALVGIGLAIAAVVVFDLKAHGVTTLGALPTGLPSLTLPSIDAMRELVPLALLIALVVMMQTAAVDRGMRQPSGDIDVTNRNFVGIGAGNVVAGLFGTFPVNASPPRSAVLEAAGATSRFAAVTAGAVVVAIALGGGALLANVPDAALAGVLLFVAARIFRVGQMASIGRQAPTELLLVLLTAAAIVLLPIQAGVAIGIGLSLLHGVWVTTRARPIELWPLPGTTIWWPSGEAGAEKPVAGVLVLAFQAPLLFANAEVFKRGIISFIEAAATPPSLVVLEASSIADIDYTAAQALRDVIAYCHNRGIIFAIARLEAVRAHEALERLGILSELGPSLLYHSVDEAVRAHTPQASPPRS